jgi:hypothetical protein
MQCNAVQCSAVQCNAVQCSAMQCNAMQYTLYMREKGLERKVGMMGIWLFCLYSRQAQNLEELYNSLISCSLDYN